ncbi:hypothetical protein Dimus_021408 [Dionaea muscipula]
MNPVESETKGNRRKKGDTLSVIHIKQEIEEINKNFLRVYSLSSLKVDAEREDRESDGGEDQGPSELLLLNPPFLFPFLLQYSFSSAAADEDEDEEYKNHKNEVNQSRKIGSKLMNIVGGIRLHLRDRSMLMSK